VTTGDNSDAMLGWGVAWNYLAQWSWPKDKAFLRDCPAFSNSE
jgi:hypothetical protein